MSSSGAGPTVALGTSGEYRLDKNSDRYSIDEDDDSV